MVVSFEEMMINLIDNNEELANRDLCKLVSKYNIGIRWKGECVKTIVELQGRTFAIENQGHELYSQPYEVEEVDKTITITEWVKKED